MRRCPRTAEPEVSICVAIHGFGRENDEAEPPSGHPQMTPIPTLFTRNANTAANLESQAPAEGQQNVSNVYDVREAVTVEATAFVASELSRQQEEWRRTFGSVKETLSNLEQAWEAATRKGQDEA